MSPQGVTPCVSEEPSVSLQPGAAAPLPQGTQVCVCSAPKPATFRESDTAMWSGEREGASESSRAESLVKVCGNHSLDECLLNLPCGARLQAQDGKQQMQTVNTPFSKPVCFLSSSAGTDRAPAASGTITSRLQPKCSWWRL